MKIKHLVTFVLLVTPAFLVPFYGRSQSIIPRAGVTFATVSGNVNDFNTSKAPDIQFTTGYYAGLAFLFPLDESRMMLQTELLWIKKGLESELGPQDEFSQLHQSNVRIYRFDRYRINYLEMPVLFRADFGKPGKTFFLLGGFSLSYGLSGKWHYHFSYYHPDESWTQTTDGKILYKDASRSNVDTQMVGRFDFGLQAGLGVMIYKALTVEARYGHGFIEFSRKNQEASAQNRVIQVGISFPVILKR